MDNKVLVHKHLIIRAEAYNPPMEEDYLKWWFEKFIKEIGMKVMMGPYIKYSNMGIIVTGKQIGRAHV